MTRQRRETGQPRSTLPRVNLLSASTFAQLAVRKLRRRFLVAVVCLLLLVATSGALQHLRVVEAERLVAVEKAETTRLATDGQALAPVRAFVDGVTLQEQTVRTNMADEVSTSKVLEALQDATPPGVHLTTLNLSISAEQPAAGGEAAPMTLPCPGPDPFSTRTVVGCVNLSGTAASRAEVGELVIRLGEVALFVEPYISTTTTDVAVGVAFGGSVGLSQDALSSRFDIPAEAALDVVSQ